VIVALRALRQRPVVPRLMIGYLLTHIGCPGKGNGNRGRHSRDAGLGIAFTLRSQLGLRMLRFVTLVPVVVAVAALLKIGSFQVDQALSARPLAKQLARWNKTAGRCGIRRPARNRVRTRLLSQSDHQPVRIATGPVDDTSWSLHGLARCDCAPGR